MKTIIAGSREGMTYADVEQAVNICSWIPTVIISGTARGVDRLGEQFAANNGIPVNKFPADWEAHGKSAGYKRNELMADNADALIAIWDGESKGTKHMIDIAKRKGLKVYVCIVKESTCY